MRTLLAVTLLLCLLGFAQTTYAGPCDLTVAGSTCSVAFGATSAVYTNVLPTGTFYVDPFLQMKTSGGATTEQGYNTTGTLQFQSQGDTGALQLSAVPVVTIGGVQYREFLLAVNEPGGSPLISLDQLQIFLGSTSSLTNYSTSTRTLSGLTAIYDLDSGGDSYIKLNYSLGATSGPGAMIAYVPNSLFTQSSSTQYVYLYSQFGVQSGAGGGLEEWWVRTPSTSALQVTRNVTPEPGTLVLLGSALSLAGVQLRRRRRSPVSTP
jgi:hypothetical protein